MSTDLLQLARAVAVEAGDLAAARRREGVEVAATKSSIVDVVTAADREVEELIRARIAEARPYDGVLGEEGGATGGTSGVTWVVDPIDGTVNYLYGIPHYAVSIALVEGDPDPATWTALVGVVYNPASGELYTATRGGGALLGDHPIRVADPVPLEQALIGTGFAYDAELRGQQGAVAARMLPSVRDIRRFGTASIDLTSVAAGRLNAFYERTLNPWDHAAGALIAEEAGALVKGLGDAHPSREFLIAGHPDVVRPLEELLVELGV
ncbi:inositol monophosphatase [Protaetiibacter sp. SSC-01]|uniref:inositol monophosphatase family protein n=1 Tax=Protaetiibacter sp. SSC-01 TaxID=2759943 RepID=UPI0016573D36|nr:inositol monophosphatase family protein [Protaetiibacter sp. SSC-01]QNO37229.1 inositol monophosphatase [Protaetiibacter sp. SSC-01]